MSDVEARLRGQRQHDDWSSSSASNMSLADFSSGLTEGKRSPGVRIISRVVWRVEGEKRPRNVKVEGREGGYVGFDVPTTKADAGEVDSPAKQEIGVNVKTLLQIQAPPRAGTSKPDSQTQFIFMSGNSTPISRAPPAHTFIASNASRDKHPPTTLHPDLSSQVSRPANEGRMTNALGSAHHPNRQQLDLGETMCR
ncbi:hypothetical protein GALMADRAFT_147693 [Galerina marginata CBS 339.88]|uniref:Uncharacterized protein n=1 Tax=Galerina marginata (strain CBS 339.88) TaxID=685588 RepID=A0A067S767_GALM3|nr:hypothetical protein GALMADRAFT_147693 [Galerina marginata CBS 339.88]